MADRKNTTCLFLAAMLLQLPLGAKSKQQCPLFKAALKIPSASCHLKNNSFLSIIRIAHTRLPPPHTPPYRLGLNGLLNPPTRFIYCLYSVFFSFRTPYTLFPFTLVFFVDLNPVNPIALRISATSGSDSASRSIRSVFPGGFDCAVEAVVVVAPLASPLGLGEEGRAGGGAFEGGALAERGPVGGARLEGGLGDRGGLDGRGGERARGRVVVWSFRGERERSSASSGSALAVSFSCLESVYQPRRDRCFSRLLLRSLSLRSLAPSRSSSLCLRPPLSLEWLRSLRAFSGRSRDRLLSRRLSLDLDL